MTSRCTHPLGRGWRRLVVNLNRREAWTRPSGSYGAYLGSLVCTRKTHQEDTNHTRGKVGGPLRPVVLLPKTTIPGVLHCRLQLSYFPSLYMHVYITLLPLTPNTVTVGRQLLDSRPVLPRRAEIWNPRTMETPSGSGNDRQIASLKESIVNVNDNISSSSRSN